MTKKDKSKEVDTVQEPSGSDLISFEDLDTWFDDFLSRRWPSPFSNIKFPEWPGSTGSAGNLPKVDIIDHDKEVEVQAALPGVKKENLEVSINENSITIRASTRTEEKKEGKQYFRKEISRGQFQRTLQLPDNVDSENAKASFKDGILEVTIPKLEKSKRKNIEIK